MKPSEFWTRVLALPEQARQAEQDASDLRSSADALCEWARLALDAQRRATALADDNDLDQASLILDSLVPRPDARSTVIFDLPRESSATIAGKPRKRRSDAGNPRVRVGTNKDGSPKYNGQVDRRSVGCDSDPTDDDGGRSANPADVKARDAERVKLAGELRTIIGSLPDPTTVSWLYAQVDEPSEDKIRDALKLLSLVSWRMQREGDSQPVEVWGTWRQLREHIERGYADSANDETIAKDLAISVQNVRFALGASRV